MTRITLPSDREAAIAEVGALAALLDKNGWKAAAFIAVSVKPGEGQGARTSGTSARGRLSAVAFAKQLNAKGWSRHVIERHFGAWEKAADDGLVPHAADLNYGDRVDVPTEGWADYYPPTSEWFGGADKEAIVAQAEADGTSATKALEIGNNPKAMAAAIKASPKAAAAAAAALEDTTEADELAAKVMSNPARAEVALGSSAVRNAVNEAEISRMKSKREKTTPSPKVPRSSIVGHTVHATLTLSNLMDDIRNGLNAVGAAIEDGLDDEMLSIVRDFLVQEVILLAQGYLDSPAMTGRDITPEAFGA